MENKENKEMIVPKVREELNGREVKFTARCFRNQSDLGDIKVVINNQMNGYYFLYIGKIMIKLESQDLINAIAIMEYGSVDIECKHGGLRAIKQ